MSTQNNAAEGRKGGGVRSLLKALLALLLVPIIVLLAWIAFSGLHRRDSLEFLPASHSVYLRADSIWQVADSLLDLEATDIILSSQGMADVRALLMDLRQSELRSNRLISLAASRRVDGGLYLGAGQQPDFVVVVDMGLLSAASRLAKFILGFIPLEGVSLVQGQGSYHIEVKLGEGTLYARPYANTLVAASRLDLLRQAGQGNNKALYAKNELELLAKDTGLPLQIIADARQLVQAATGDNHSLARLANLISPDTKALVALELADEEIALHMDVPLSLQEGQPSSFEPQLEGVRRLLQQESTLPLLLSQLGGNIQYYTIFNGGTLRELKEAALPLLPADLDAPSLWSTADRLCRSLFGVSIEELVFSWTGRECALLGVEGLNAPAIALEITDEGQRQYIFDQVLSSIILKDDTSLILNGVRLPRIHLPPFLQGVLELFGVSMPTPYYMIHKGFIYFSESAETLSAIFSSIQGGERLSGNLGWQLVSERHSSETSAGIFYDLERGTPFFVRGNSLVSDILELYAIGLLNVRIQDSSLVCQLNVASRPSGQLRSIPGFPLNLGGTADQLCSRSSSLFWVENGRLLKAMDIKSMAVKEKEFRSPIVICPAAGDGGAGAVWAVTAEGAVYLLTPDLQDAAAFPLLTGARPATRPTAAGDTLVQPMEDGTLHFVDSKGRKEALSLELGGSIKAPLNSLEGTMAFYDKGFMGNVRLFDSSKRELLSSQQVVGIAFGSPALMKSRGSLYVGFITQAGRLTIWRADRGGLTPVADISVPGIFFTNVVGNGNYFFALSSDARLHRIDLEGNCLTVQIPNATAQHGSLSVIESRKTGLQNVYVGVDGNTLYGFNDNLELLQGFPLAGSGIPLFVDANGDGREDCITLTIDNKLNGWNLR